MKIIFLSPEAIFPVNTGGRLVVYNRIKYLTGLGHEIYFFSIVDDECEIEIQQQHLKAIVKECFSYNRHAHKITNYLKAARYPYSVASRIRQTLIDDLEKLIIREKIKLVICEFPQMYMNLRELQKRYKFKCVLSQHNIEFLSLRNIGQKMNNPLKRMLYLLESIRLERYERKIYRNNLIDAFIFVSKDDKEFFERELNINNRLTNLAPIGAEEHDDLQKIDDGNKNVIIVGKMSYPPNAEGVLWFYNNVWSKITSEVKNSVLYIVGKDPDDRLLKINSDNVIVTGTVESVEPYYLKANAIAIPIFSGGGVKTKLIEASSYSVPIICTTSGARGTDFKDAEHIYITDDAQSFADKIISVLKEDKSQIEMVYEASKLFKQKYTWDGITKDLSYFLEKLIQKEE